MNCFKFLVLKGLIIYSNCLHANLAWSPKEQIASGVLRQERAVSFIAAEAYLSTNYFIKDLTEAGFWFLGERQNSSCSAGFQLMGTPYIRFFDYYLSYRLRLSEDLALGINSVLNRESSVWDKTQNKLRIGIEGVFRLRNLDQFSVSVLTAVRKPLSTMIHGTFIHEVNSNIAFVLSASYRSSMFRLSGSLVYQVNRYFRMHLFLSTQSSPFGLGMMIKHKGFNFLVNAKYHLDLGVSNDLSIWGQRSF